MKKLSIFYSNSKNYEAIHANFNVSLLVKIYKKMVYF